MFTVDVIAIILTLTERQTLRHKNLIQSKPTEVDLILLTWSASIAHLYAIWLSKCSHSQRKWMAERVNDCLHPIIREKKKNYKKMVDSYVILLWCLLYQLIFSSRKLYFMHHRFSYGSHAIIIVNYKCMTMKKTKPLSTTQFHYETCKSVCVCECFLFSHHSPTITITLHIIWSDESVVIEKASTHTYMPMNAISFQRKP